MPLLMMNNVEATNMIDFEKLITNFLSSIKGLANE